MLRWLFEAPHGDAAAIAGRAPRLDRIYLAPF
jgi:hypothetical protein